MKIVYREMPFFIRGQVRGGEIRINSRLSELGYSPEFVVSTVFHERGHYELGHERWLRRWALAGCCCAGLLVFLPLPLQVAGAYGLWSGAAALILRCEIEADEYAAQALEGKPEAVRALSETAMLFPSRLTLEERVGWALLNLLLPQDEWKKVLRKRAVFWFPHVHSSLGGCGHD